MAELFDYMVGDLGRDEADKGIRHDVYKDTEGYLTVGRGHRVVPGDKLAFGDVIDADREKALFAYDINRNIEAARRAVPGFDQKPMEFQRGVTNLLYQMGESTPDKFSKAFGHLNSGKIEDAIREFGVGNDGVSDSLWKQQTPNRFQRTMDMLRSSIGKPPPTAPSPTGGPPTAPVSLSMPSDEPDSWLGRRTDEVEMLAKSMGAGLLNTGALALQVLDGPLDLTDGAANKLSDWAGQVNATIPEWIKEDIYKKTIISDGQGGWEFNVDSLDDMAGLMRKAGFYIAGSAAPGGAIAMGGKGVALAGAKLLPKFFKQGARMGPAAAYGTANAGYIAADSYQNVYSTVYSNSKQRGLSDQEAMGKAEDAAQLAALASGMIALGTGTIGGLAMTGGGLMSRVAKGATLGAATEAVEEPGQYVAEQLAMGEAVDPLEVAERALLGAFTAGPMEGAMAGMAGTNTEAEVDPAATPEAVSATAKQAGEDLIDEVLAEPAAIPYAEPLMADDTTVLYEGPAAPELPVALPRDDIPAPQREDGMEPLDLRSEYFDGLEGEGTTTAPGQQQLTSVDAQVDMGGTPLPPAPEPAPEPEPVIEPEPVPEPEPDKRTNVQLRGAIKKAAKAKGVPMPKGTGKASKAALHQTLAELEAMPEQQQLVEPTPESKQTEAEAKMQALIDAEAEADAAAEAAAEAEYYGTTEDETDAADAAIEAYAKRVQEKAEAEPEPEPTPEEIQAGAEAELRAEADEAAGALIGKHLQAALEERGLAKGGKKLDKQKRVADHMYQEKIEAQKPAPQPLADAVDIEGMEAEAAAKLEADKVLAEEKLAKDQAKWDEDTKRIEGKKVSELRAILKSLNMDDKGNKPALIERLMEGRSPRPEPVAVPEEVVAEGEAATTATPAEAETGTAPVDTNEPAPEVAPEPEPEPEPEVTINEKGEVKPKKVKAVRKPVDKKIRESWGEGFLRSVYTVTVGNRVFTAWRGKNPVGPDGKQIRGEGQSYVYVEKAPEDFNPTDSGLILKYTGAKNADDMKAAIERTVQEEQESAENQAADEFRRKQPATKDEEVIAEDMRAKMLRARAGLMTADEMVDAAIEMRDAMANAESGAVSSSILKSFEALEEVYNRKYGALGGNLREVAGAKRDEANAAIREGADRAEKDIAGAAASERRAKEAEDQRKRNLFEQKVLEAEQNRGLSMEAAGYWFRARMRKLTGRGTPSPEDLDYKQQHPKQAAILEKATISEVISRALASQKHKWWVRLGDSRLALKERLAILREVIEEHNAGLDPVLDKDKFWEWTDEMDVYVLYDQQDAKVGSRIDDFNREFQKKFAAGLKAAGVTEAEMNDYMVSVHALARNLYLKELARKNGNKEPGQALSGVTDAQANEAIDRVTNNRDPARMAALEQLFEEHIMAMTAEQRSVYRDHGLVPDQILDTWEPPVKPADIYGMPDPTAPGYLDKVNALYRYTYVPLQHTPVDYNSEMLVANLRKTDTAGIGDVYGDEVKAAMGQSQSEILPQHAYAQIKANIIKAYVRAAHNDTLRALGEVASKHANRYMWHVVKGTQEFKLDPLTGELVEVPVSTKEEGYVVGQDLRKQSGISAFRDQEMTSLRFKMADGTPAILQVHDSLLATALAPESTLNSWPMRNLGKLSRWVSSINTTYSPGFMLVNPVRDYLSAKIQLSEEGMTEMRKNISVKNYKKVFKAYWAELRGEPHDGTDPMRNMIDRYRMAGGHTQFYRPERLADHVRSLESDLSALDADGSGPNIKKMLTGVRDVMKDTNTVIENIARILAFEAAVKAGKTDQQAANISKNLVVNFGRRGTWGPALNALYPFYNASVQGNAILYQTWKRSPNVRKATAALAGLGLANGIMQELTSGDDDDGRSKYSNLSDHVRERNLVFFIPGTDGDYIKVPLPYGLNVPVVIGDSLASLFTGSADPKDHVRQLMRPFNAAKGSFNPIASSTLERTVAPLFMEPMVDMYRNRNFFGSPINPDRSPYEKGKRADAFNVTDPDDSRWSTKIAQQVAYMTGGNVYREGLIDVGPGTIRYMWDFALGSAGSTVRRAMEAVTADTLHEAGVKVPVIRRLYGTMNDFHHKERYYDMREELHKLKNERKLFHANRRADPEAYEDFKREHGDYWSRGVMGRFDATEKRLRGLIRDKNKIRKLSNKNQRQRNRMDKYDEAINKTVTNFNSYYYNKFILGDRA